MKLLPGCRLAVAPRFHLPVDWPDRLSLGAGVEKVARNFCPRPPWRPANEHELALLVADPAAAETAENLWHCLRLFQIPRHLWLKFWKMLDQAREKGEARLDGFDGFVGEVTRFLAFKGLTVPPGAACEVVLKQPGQQPMLGRAIRSPWVGINLGDEPTSIVFINLTAEQMRGQWDELPAASPTSPGEWAELFLGRYPDYPAVRLRIEPGEGYLLPCGGLLLDSSTLEATEPALSLVIHGLD